MALGGRQNSPNVARFSSQKRARSRAPYRTRRFRAREECEIKNKTTEYPSRTTSSFWDLNSKVSKCLICRISLCSNRSPAFRSSARIRSARKRTKGRQSNNNCSSGALPLRSRHPLFLRLIARVARARAHVHASAYIRAYCRVQLRSELISGEDKRAEARRWWWGW